MSIYRSFLQLTCDDTLRKTIEILEESENIRMFLKQLKDREVSENLKCDIRNASNDSV